MEPDIAGPGTGIVAAKDFADASDQWLGETEQLLPERQFL
jgi:hypothetical protein